MQSLLLLLLPSAPLCYFSALDCVSARGSKRKTYLVSSHQFAFFRNFGIFCLCILFVASSPYSLAPFSHFSFCCFSLRGLPSTTLSCGRPLDSVVLRDSCFPGLYFLQDVGPCGFVGFWLLILWDVVTPHKLLDLVVTLCQLPPGVFHILRWRLCSMLLVKVPFISFKYLVRDFGSVFHVCTSLGLGLFLLTF